MKGRAIRIDWDDLENAFNNKNDEIVYYLDTVTGHVHLDDEGEDEDFDDEDELTDGAATATASAKDSTRLYVEPPDGETEAGWMREFLEDVTDLDAAAVERLERALEAPDPANAFRHEIRDDATLRDRWFLYRSDRIHEYIASWLDANAVHIAEPPPWN